MYKSSIFSVGHSFYGKDSLVAAKVPTLSLKKLFERYNLKKVDFMKIDTEGAEYDIILNTPKRVLKKINKMIIEYHDYLNHGHSWIELQEYLQKAGFKTELALSVFQRKLFGLGHIRAWRD